MVDGRHEPLGQERSFQNDWPPKNNSAFELRKKLRVATNHDAEGSIILSFRRISTHAFCSPDSSLDKPDTTVSAC